MPRPRWLPLACLIIGLTAFACCSKKDSSSSETSSSASSSEPTTKEKLVGVWEVVKSDDLPAGEWPKGANVTMTVEYTEDGKFIVKFSGSVDGKKVETFTGSEGTYDLDGDKFTVTQKDENNKERKDVETIKTLTATELVVTNQEGKTDVLRKGAQPAEVDRLRSRIEDLEEEIRRLKAERKPPRSSSGRPPRESPQPSSPPRASERS
jgi:uncharacterized protein (TIGR03066 family)